MFSLLSRVPMYSNRSTSEFNTLNKEGNNAYSNQKTTRRFDR